MCLECPGVAHWCERGLFNFFRYS
uniref:Uncharacterized protein n=1 Tax=Anguilla anguilla TaxID=7936 RepID=A0A0E9XSU9_ANGAN